MKKQLIVRSFLARGLIPPFAIAALLLAPVALALAGLSAKDNPDNPGVMSPLTNHFGKTYAEWTAQW